MTDPANSKALTATTPSSRAAAGALDYLVGARLSERFKDAFKVALAMLITYGVSMAMDWDKPFWAALSVIFCSLATAGASINKSVDRIKGTALAALMALLVISIFPQDRWLFMLAVSLLIAFCSYRMTGPTPRRDIWLNAGFNLPIIALLGEMGGSLAPATFEVAVLRVEQTALGAVVYSLVAVLVWPRRGDLDFIDTMLGIARSQQAVFAAQLGRLKGGRCDGDELESSLAHVAGQLPLLVGKLEGAAYDSDEVEPVSGAWRRHINNVQSLHMAFERWNSGAEDLQGLDIRRYLPGLEEYTAEIDACLAAVEPLLDGGEAPRERRVVNLEVDEGALRELDHFRRAAVVSCRDRLTSIASLAASLRRSAGEVGGGKPVHPYSESLGRGDSGWSIDPDRLSSVVRQSTALWLCFLAVIYVPSVPIPVGLIALANAFSMAFGWAPHVPATVLLKPVVMGSVLGGILYIAIMPHLSGFAEFGTMLFLATFAVAYVFGNPRAILVKYMMLTMTVIIISAENQQTYNFLVFANWSLVGVLFIGVMLVAWRFPISFKAEDRFQAQLRRYLRSAAFLLADLSGGHEAKAGRLHRWRRAFHVHELNILPSRLRTWSAALPPAALGSTAPAELERLLNGLQRFSLRMQDLQEAYPEAMKTEPFVHLRSHDESLRNRLREIFEGLATDPAVLDEQRCRQLLDSGEERFAHGVDEALDAVGTEREQGQRIYRLLGTYRGLLGAFGNIMGGLSAIDWACLRESRF